MKKLILVLPILLILTINILALDYTLIRGTGGNIANIGTDNSFSYSKIQFSSYLREPISEKNGFQGQGSLLVMGKNNKEKPVVIAINFKSDYYAKYGENLWVKSNGRLTYYDGTKVTVYDKIDIYYYYDTSEKKSYIYGMGSVPFTINAISS